MVRETKSAISGPGVTANTKLARAKARITERSGTKKGMIRISTCAPPWATITQEDRAFVGVRNDPVNLEAWPRLA
ncbi:hypothetical protein GCM10010862_17100 [Devosia nitrariae]|uniref:Uncharacterized protein n=1 Tax=Devosia nitrariae TaxID=2071872 RepID=A0ABQ5W439_9HYPH|nr:hypothetical protein GCM10010862_17100 [Devosia nitrariae]